jgi:hypothetical protein
MHVWLSKCEDYEWANFAGMKQAFLVDTIASEVRKMKWMKQIWILSANMSFVSEGT